MSWRTTRAGARSTPSMLASMSAPLRLAGAFCWALAVLYVAVFVAIVFTEPDEAFPWAALLGPAFLLAIGQVLRYTARNLETGRGPEMPRVGAWIFGTAGAAMVIGGIVMVFDDPAGFALIAFGAVFIGAGWLAHKLFATPRGMKAVTVSTHQADAVTTHGGVVTRSSGTRIFVEENATEEQVQARRRRWQHEQWQRRPDWVAGRVQDENARSGGLLVVGTVLWLVFALGFLGLAMFSGEPFWWWVAAPGLVVAAALIFMSVRQRLHQRKYLPSHFVMRETPARLGARLCGEIETGVLQRMRVPDGFHLRLECVHRWEERVGSLSDRDRKTRMRRVVLWRAEARAGGRPLGGVPARMAVSVDFDLPADLPATTLDSGSEGVSWELHVRAAVPGLDYRARFNVPVLATDDLVGAG